MKVQSNFGKNLRERMLARGIGPTELADQLEMNRTNVYRWFQTSRPNNRTIYRISRILECEPKDLLQ